jgi:hypothetical protein
MYRFLVVLVLLLVPAAGFAQVAEQEVVGEVGFYHQTSIRDGEVSPRASLDGYHAVAGPMGGWGFIWAEKQYLSVLGGIYLEVLEIDGATLSIGAGGGAALYPDESGNYGLEGRYAVTAELAGEKFAAELYYENGESKESWHQASLDLSLSSVFSAGVFAQTGEGIGPRVTAELVSLPVRVWVAPMFNSGSRRGILLGGEITFESKR